MYWSRWWYGDMVAGGWWGGKVRRGQEESLGDERRMGFGPWKLCQFSSVSIGEKDVLYRLLGEEEWTIVETKEGGWSKVESVGHLDMASLNVANFSANISTEWNYTAHPETSALDNIPNNSTDRNSFLNWFHWFTCAATIPQDDFGQDLEEPFVIQNGKVCLFNFWHLHKVFWLERWKTEVTYWRPVFHPWKIPGLILSKYLTH